MELKNSQMIFKQFASTASCVQSFMLAQKGGSRISQFWSTSGESEHLLLGAPYGKNIIWAPVFTP